MGLAIAALALVGCSSGDADRVTPPSASSAAAPSVPGSADATAAPATAAPATVDSVTGATAGSVPADDDGHVRVMGLWSGPEYDSFAAVASDWEGQTGDVVDWTGAQDLPGELRAAIEAGAAPDLAILPNVGLLHELAAAGELVPLSTVLDPAEIERDDAPAWQELGSHDGELYGLFVKVTDKSTVWYSPAAFEAAGYTVPSTWDELLALATTMVADGRTPFSVVAPRLPGGGGWALTDWVAQLVLGHCGPDVYDAWVAAEIPWTDTCIADAFRAFDTVLHTPGFVAGGEQGILGTSDAEGSYPMYTDPPGAYMYPLASFAQAFITSRFPQLVAGEGYGFFPFPTVDPGNAGAVIVGGDVVVMLHDTPAARSFLAHLVGAPAQEAWVRLGGFVSVNRSVDPAAYPDAVARAVAEHLAGATVVRYSAGDVLPAAVQQAWWRAMVRLVQDPVALDDVLTSLTTTAASAPT